MCRCRRTTLLWLDDHPDSPENSRIRRGIPGLAADSSDAALEDQVDVTLFTSVDDIEAFLRHPSQIKFTKYPPSLFRIVTNRRLFVGPSGLCARMGCIPHWQSVFPAIMVFHGKCNDGLDALRGRPNLIITRSEQHCSSFVAFQSVKVAAARGTQDATAAPAQVSCARVARLRVVRLCSCCFCTRVFLAKRFTFAASQR